VAILVQAAAGLTFKAVFFCLVGAIIVAGVYCVWRAYGEWHVSQPPPKKSAAHPLNGPEARKLRNSLHLNVAACALKKEDWYLARVAAEKVLAVDPESPKALYRLAQAHNGASELKEAVRALSTLLKVEGQRDNREARRLLADVQDRRSREKAFFNGVCNRSGFYQSQEEEAAAKARGESESRNRIKSPMDLRFEAYSEQEQKRKVGFKWEMVTESPISEETDEVEEAPTYPRPGKEIFNEQLVQELRKGQTVEFEFTWLQLDEWVVPLDLQENDFIMVDDNRFEPRERGFMTKQALMGTDMQMGQKPRW